MRCKKVEYSRYVSSRFIFVFFSSNIIEVMNYVEKNKNGENLQVMQSLNKLSGTHFIQNTI